MSNATSADKIRDYRSDYNNRYVTTVLIIITVTLTLSLSCKPFLPPLTAFTVSLCAFCFLQTEKETVFLQFQELRACSLPSSNLRSGTTFAKTTALCINLNIDDAPISSPTPLPLTNLSPPLHYKLETNHYIVQSDLVIYLSPSLPLRVTSIVLSRARVILIESVF